MPLATQRWFRRTLPRFVTLTQFLFRPRLRVCRYILPLSIPPLPYRLFKHTWFATPTLAFWHATCISGVGRTRATCLHLATTRGTGSIPADLLVDALRLVPCWYAICDVVVS